MANNTQVNVVSFIIGEMAKAIAEFLEKELLTGTTNCLLYTSWMPLPEPYQED